MRDSVLEYLDEPTDDGRLELLDRYQAWRENNRPLNDYEVTVAAKTDKTRRVFPNLRWIPQGPVVVERRRPRNLRRRHPHRNAGTDAAARARSRSDTDWPTDAETLTQAVANSMARFHHIDATYVAGQLRRRHRRSGDHARNDRVREPDQRPMGDRRRSTFPATSSTKLDKPRPPPPTTRNAGDETSARSPDVLPTPLTPAEIHPELGVTWLSAPRT